MGSRVRGIVAALALLGASIAFALGTAEACLRLFPGAVAGRSSAEAPLPSTNEPATRGHPYLGHLFPRNYQGRFERDGGNFSFTYTTDEHGFRNRSPWPPRAEIVVVGDSMAFGYGVEDDETWTALLEKDLPRARFINLGLVGAAPQQYLRVYATFGQGLQPALVLFCLFPGNDVKDAGLFDRWVRAGAQGDYYTWRSSDNGGDDRLDPRDLLAQSYVVMFLRHVRTHATSQLQGKTIGFGDGSRLQLVSTLNDDLDRQTNSHHPNFRMTLDAVTQTRALAEQNGSAFLGLLVPTKEEVYLPLLDQEPPPLTAPFAAQFEKLGLPYLDLTSGFRARARQGERLFFEVDGHPNAAGYRLMADLVLAHWQGHAESYNGAILE